MKNITAYFILLFSSYSVFPDSKPVNLMYRNSGFTAESYLKKTVCTKKSNCSPYILPKGKNDPRFISIHKRISGTDQSRRVIQLGSGDSLQYRLFFPLNHSLRLQSEYGETEVLLNGESAKDGRLVSKKNYNIITVRAKKETLITEALLLPEKREKQPDVLFIVIDSLRGDVPGFNGGKFGVTPKMDEISGSSYVFKKHLVNASWTRPSTFIFFTGIYASKSRINFWDYPVFQSEREQFYALENEPLPALLAENGYRSVMIGNNPFLTDYRYIGVDAGFQSVKDFSPAEEDTLKITDEFFRFWKSLPKEREPVFLFLNYNDPHKPYTPPAEFFAQVKADAGMEEKKRNYLGETAFVDFHIGRILQFLKERKELDNILLIITSDHGEVMNRSHSVSVFNGVYTLYGHGQGLYEEDIHTPLIIRLPGQKEKKEISYAVRSIDIYPTVLEALKIAEPFHIDGKSLFPLMTEKEKDDRFYYGESRGVRGVRNYNYKFMEKTHEFHRPGPAWKGNIEKELSVLFNLREDPDENTPQKNQRISEKLCSEIPSDTVTHNTYYIRVYGKGKSGKKAKISIRTENGEVRLLKKTERAVWNSFGKNASAEVSDSSAVQEISFRLYPDFGYPDVRVEVNGRLAERGEIGAGVNDIYPYSCSLKKEECRDMFFIRESEPSPSDSEFRVQLFARGINLKNEKENVILEKEAVDILKKQGYIK